jgi:hypothetical protein
MLDALSNELMQTATFQAWVHLHQMHSCSSIPIAEGLAFDPESHTVANRCNLSHGS